MNHLNLKDDDDYYDDSSECDTADVNESDEINEDDSDDDYDEHKRRIYYNHPFDNDKAEDISDDGEKENYQDHEEEEEDGDDDDDNQDWVQCDECEKWRTLPSYMSSDDLPSKWYCSMNTWNPTLANCDAPQEEGAEDGISLASLVEGEAEGRSSKLCDDDLSCSVSSSDESKGRRGSNSDDEFDLSDESKDEEDEEEYGSDFYEEESGEEEDLAGEDDLSDSDLCELDRPGASLRSRMPHQTRYSELANLLPTSIVPLEEQQEILEKIDNDADRALQKILFNARFQYTLYHHQFKAVRLAAGVPNNFPLHRGSRVRNAFLATISEAVYGLNLRENQPATKGLCIADAMGLGKTVEAVAGAIVANEAADALGEPEMPTLIVAPNDAVLWQWMKTLVENGVPLERIVTFKRGDTLEDQQDENIFVVLTRHTAFAEIRAIFDTLSGNNPSSGQQHNSGSRSALFPYAHNIILKHLCNEYNYDKSKGRRTIKEPGELHVDCVTRILKSCALHNQRDGNFAFRLCILDEAHFLKNRLTFQTMATALSCAHSSRTLPMTGTPYNNGLDDLATLMTLIDPTLGWATSKWWKDREGQIAQATAAIRNNFILRRDKQVIAHLLTDKIMKKRQVPITKREIKVYEYYEDSFARLLKRFQQLMDNRDDPIVMQQLKDMHKTLFGLLGCTRMALVHPLLPGKGREVTQLFSPSRCKLSKAVSLQDQCVCCQRNLCPLAAAEQASKETPDFVGSEMKPFSGSNHPDPDDDMMDNEEDSDECIEEAAFYKNKTPVYEIPKGVCCASTGVKHFAHEGCIKKLEREHKRSGGVTCPRCLDLAARMVKSGSSCDMTRYYCKEVVNKFPQGFVGSPKLDAVVKWATRVPRRDKIIIMSFFKGALDLLEAILVHDYDWNCSRFDGDVTSEVKQEELDRFQRDSSCRVLLMTVQSGGVGLNITEANHVAFLDRWFNPFVHEQAEDRCHRLGQEKDVCVNYFDCAATFDEAMVQINELKQANSHYLFDERNDDTPIGTGGAGLTYTEMSGLLGSLVETIRRHRTDFLLEDEENHQSQCFPPAYNSVKNRVRKHRERKSSVGTSKSGAQREMN